MMPATVDRPACRSTGSSWAWRAAGRPGLHRSATPFAQQTLANFSPTCLAQIAGPTGRAARRPRLAVQKDTACRFLTSQFSTNLKLAGDQSVLVASTCATAFHVPLRPARTPLVSQLDKLYGQPSWRLSVPFAREKQAQTTSSSSNERLSCAAVEAAPTDRRPCEGAPAGSP